MGSNFTALPGSRRHTPPSWKTLSPCNPDQEVELSIHVRRRRELPSDRRLAALAASHCTLTRGQLAVRYGAETTALTAVERLARDHDFTVTDVSQARRLVRITGPLGALAETFPAELRSMEHLGAAHRRRAGFQYVPEAIGGAVEALFGFSSSPRARPHVVRAQVTPCAELHAASLDATEVARLYGFPEDLDGSGQCIGLIELGGGYRKDDLHHHFSRLRLPCPEVVAVSTGGKINAPGWAPLFDLEVALDLQVAGAVAPGARLAVYLAEWTEKGWIDALQTAIHDRVNRPSILSISWGWAEREAAGQVAWTEAAVEAVNALFKEAALLGITVICAAGDDGVADGIHDHHAHVDFPASSPYVLGCGGTTLIAREGVILEERAWKAGRRTDPNGGTTGGGVSALHPLPAWQASAGVPLSIEDGLPGRGVPDVAGNADQATGYRIRVDGEDCCVGGTSAVAPLYAGLFARINQKLGAPVGYVTPRLYALPAHVFRDVVSGDNGTPSVKGYPAREGWDACTGRGSIVGHALCAALLADRDAPTRSAPPAPLATIPPASGVTAAPGEELTKTG